MGAACGIITLLITLVLLAYGFKLVLEAKPKKEGDTAFISTQLRGFGYLAMASLVFAVGMAMCITPAVFGLEEKMAEFFGNYE